MEVHNRKTMQIDKNILSEENYTGVRKIKVNSSMAMKYKKEIDELQKQANPILNKMEKVSKTYEPQMDEIRKLSEQINKIKAEIKPFQDEYETHLKKVELLDQKANMIKNKLYPLVMKEIEGQLGEFEEAREVTTEKGVMFVNVHDKIEEYIKTIRKQKAVKETISK